MVASGGRPDTLTVGSWIVLIFPAAGLLYIYTAFPNPSGPIGIVWLVFLVNLAFAVMVSWVGFSARATDRRRLAEVEAELRRRREL